MNLPLANLFGPENWALLAIAAVLLFGRRLPEVGRSIGKGIVEFKKGLQGIEDDIDTASTAKPQNPPHNPSIGTESPRPVLPSSYKFDPHTGRPIGQPDVQQGMKFDPYTGKPLTPETPASPPQFDPYTGKPVEKEIINAEYDEVKK
jgi:sec-independent protein translocase protein TatA